MITTTLNRIRQHGPCEDGWTRLLKGLNKTAADDEPLPFTKIVEINGLGDALWCCRAEPQYAREWRLYAVWCARQVQHLMTDQRSVAALDVAERHARGEASADELAAAWTAAKAARDAAWTAGDAGDARAAAWAAWDAARAAWDAGNAERDAADAADAAEAARDAAQAAAWAAAGAARDATLAAQTAEFLRLVTETEGRS